MAAMNVCWYPIAYLHGDDEDNIVDHYLNNTILIPTYVRIYMLYK